MIKDGGKENIIGTNQIFTKDSFMMTFDMAMDK